MNIKNPYSSRDIDSSRDSSLWQADFSDPPGANIENTVKEAKLNSLDKATQEELIPSFIINYTNIRNYRFVLFHPFLNFL